MKPKILNKTKSLCPVCLKHIDADVIIRDNKVLISKQCSEHGKFECFHAWDDPFLYKELFRLSKKQKRFAKDTMLNVTSKCNMNCQFCFSTVRHTLYEPDIQTLVEKAKSWGEGSILLFGGEPTLRKDLFKMIEQIKNLGLGVILVTNGLKLDKKFVKRLKESGVDKIELQFDSLDDDINVKMRKRKLLKYKLRAIENLSKANIPLNLSMVLVKNYNENQIGKIISFAAENSDKIVTTTISPISAEGPVNNFEVKLMNNDEVLKNIEDEFGIKKNDFIICTKFDLSLSNFLREIGGIMRINTIPCLISCHIFVINSKLIPLNRLIELEKISEILDEIVDSKYKNKLKILLQIFGKSIKKRVKIKMITIPLLIEYFISLFGPSVYKQRFKIIFKKSFGIVVRGNYQTRYNIDYNFIKKCNDYTDNKEGGFSTFCENNIFSTGPKRLKSLNFDWILNYSKS